MVVSVLGVFSKGLGSALQREFGRRSATPDGRQSLPTLLRSFEIVYWVLGAALAIGFGALALTVGPSWIRTESIPRQTVVSCLALLAVRVALAFPHSIYQSVFIGTERQVEGNVINGLLAVVGGSGRCYRDSGVRKRDRGVRGRSGNGGHLPDRAAAARVCRVASRGARVRRARGAFAASGIDRSDLDERHRSAHHQSRSRGGERRAARRRAGSLHRRGVGGARGRFGLESFPDGRVSAHLPHRGDRLGAAAARRSSAGGDRCRGAGRRDYASAVRVQR